MDDLEVDRAGDTVTLTLNRQQKRNALSPDLVEALLDEVSAAYDDGTRMLVLRGNGKNLSAGFDLDDGVPSDADLLHRFVRIEQLLQMVYHAPFQTLAFAHGRNFGAGADLFVACSLRVTSTGATFTFPGPAFGLTLGTRRLAARTGSAWADQVLGTLRTVDTRDALTSGLATDLVEEPGWPAYVDEVRESRTLVQPSTRADLGRMLTPDTRDEDLADLVRSAARPDLGARIQRFRRMRASS